MGVQDAKFNNEIFRKDNPIVLACRRDLAAFMGARLIYNSAGYLPGQCLARKVSDGLFYKWSAVSGGTYDSPCILFDTLSDSDQLASGEGLGGASGASLVRVLINAKGVYTTALIEYDAAFKTARKTVDQVDAGGVAITTF
jgi:hypothetical protein